MGTHSESKGSSTATTKNTSTTTTTVGDIGLTGADFVAVSQSQIQAGLSALTQLASTAATLQQGESNNVVAEYNGAYTALAKVIDSQESGNQTIAAGLQAIAEKSPSQATGSEQSDTLIKLGTIAAIITIAMFAFKEGG